MPYGQARRLPAPGVPSTDRLNLYPTPIADGTVIWTAPSGQTHTTGWCFPPCANPPRPSARPQMHGRPNRVAA